MLAQLIVRWAENDPSRSRRAADRQYAGRRTRARRRSRSPDRRRHYPRDGLAKARRSGAGPVRQILAVHARLPQDRAQLLAGTSQGGRARSTLPSGATVSSMPRCSVSRAASDPVIAAGSTGSMPATAKLLAAIAQLPHGAVVLPGLDTDLDEDSWRKIAGAKDENDAPAARASAILHAGLAGAHGRRARCRRTARRSRRARPRGAGFGSTAASRHHRSLAGLA